MPGVVVATAAVALAALAFLHPGVDTTEVNADDGGIWVTNQSRRMVGHLNYDARTLDAALRTETSEFDIGQSADTVTFQDLSARSVAPVDVAGVRLGATTSLGEQAVAEQGGDRMGVLDPASGSLWVTSASEPSQTAFTEKSAVSTGLVGGVVTTAQDGTVLAASGAAGTFVAVGRDGHVDRVTTTDVPDLRADADLQLTAVGSEPVALDAASNTLFLPDGSSRALSDDGVPTGGVLQEPGPASDAVLVATASELVSVPLDGSSVTATPSSADARSGTPARPVRHQSCDYAAWAGSGAYVRVCDDPAQDAALDVESLQGAGDVRFRTNRTRIVLNDIGTGSVWLPDRNMVLMSDWDQIDTELQADDEDEDSPQLTDQIADPEHTDHNTPPEAVDDRFGVRPGRATTLPVLQNDSDADGDVLTARATTPPGFGTVVPTRGGQALQITGIDEGATGSTTFTYEASDGLAVDTATVSVSIHPWDVNAGPTQLRDRGVAVGRGATVEENVLPDWIDPDGDPIFLESATAPDGLEVQFREEGTVTIRDLDSEPGPKPVQVVVSDGRASTTGTLTVNVQNPGNLAPIANADFLVARVGEPAVIQPLANDTDPNGDQLSLVGVSTAPAGSTIVPDLGLGTLSFTAQAAGTYQFTYSVSDGPAQSTGVIRVDVVEADDQAVPVAEDDLALLPQGGSALVAPLANDSDPAGGVLVIQSIDASAAPRLEVTIVDRHLLRVTAPGGLDESASFAYTVSNGLHTATAEVTVVPTAAQDDKRPPELTPDRAKVRVGDVASVSVLANDRSPAGLAMSVDPDLQYTEDPAVGRPFVTGNLVRLEAGDTPGVLHVAYTVRDSAGNMATSTVMFEVVGSDAANHAPQPKSLTAWSVSGQTTRIRVPLNGIDPDGDSVTLVGIEQAPKKGMVELNVDWLEYTPARDMVGTDVFTYIVEDRQGKQASARVRVGIAPPSPVNQPPTAVKDTVLVRPDRQVAIDVLANDIDADGDALSLVDGSLASRTPGVQARIRDDAVVVTTPGEAGSYLFTYRVSDGRGGVSDGTLTVNVSADARLQPPIARDDVGDLADLPADGSAMAIDVRANDQDPDGDVSTLVVSSDVPGTSVSGGLLSVTPDERRRLVVYTVTDVDGLSSSAVVSVPGAQQTRPRLDPSRVPVQVRAGQDLTLDIRGYVVVRSGRSALIADAATVQGSVGVGEARLVDDHTVALHVDADYSGRSSVSFEARDGGAEDSSALSAVLSIPLVVTATQNQPPVFTPTPIRVAAGEDAAAVDLAPMVRDPDGADPAGFAYRMVQAPEGLAVQLSGHTLTVRAAVDHVRGPAGSVTVSVDDGSGAVSAQIPVTVVASTRPLIQVSDALVTAANAGGTVAVDLTDYTTNPFPDVPIRIVGSSVQIGQGTVDPQGTRLLITPAAAFHGQMTVGYRLMDATGDASRMVEGQVRLVVRDRPEPPTAVSVTATGAGSALVTFQPGSDNGAPITAFTLTDLASGQTFRCPVASCPVTGLENGVTHSFSVVAHNDVGDSDASAPSAAVLVDMRPGRPNPPTVTPGDGTASVSWAAPPNEGSAITGYTVYVQSTSGSQTVEVGGAATQATIGGLTNGQAYAVSVQAHNRAEEPSDVSDMSEVVPFGRPFPPTNVQGASTSTGDRDHVSVHITWDDPQNTNGRPLTGATVTVNGVSRDVPAGQNAVDIPVDAAWSATASVTVRSEGGTSDPAASGEFHAVTAPPAPSGPIRVSADGTSNTLRVEGLAKSSGAYPAWALAVQVSADGGATWRTLEDLSAVGGLANGQSYSLQFRQYSPALDIAGDAVTADAATPYGPPDTPVVSAAAGAGGVRFTWSTGGGGGLPLTTQLVVDGVAYGAATSGGAGSVTVAGDPGTRLTASVVATDSAGQTRNSEAASGVVWGTVDIQPGACAGGEQPEGDAGSCRSFQVKAQSWDASAMPLTCTFTSDIDNRQRSFPISRQDQQQSTWVDSGQRTALTDASQIASRLSCSPPS